jgi:hypothetical protein
VILLRLPELAITHLSIITLAGWYLTAVFSYRDSRAGGEGIPCTRVHVDSTCVHGSSGFYIQVCVLGQLT